MLLYRLTVTLVLLFSTSAVCCNLNAPGPVSARLPSLLDEQAPRQVLLSNNIQLQVPSADAVLQMHSAEGFALLDQLQHWPTLSGQAGSIRAQPLVVDLDYDGAADAVYVIDIYGQLWFVALNHNGFSNPLLVADFSQSQAIFEQPLQLAQIMAPDSNGIMRRQMMLLLTGKQQQGDILLAVKHGVTRESPWQLDDLTDRTNVSVDEQRYGIAEQLWLQIQQGGGWFVRLEQRITTLPQVYAGVVYLTSADTAHVNADCSVIAEAEPQLHAFHLHHAGVVYARRHWDIDMQHSAVLALQKDDQGQLALSLQHPQEQAAQPLLTELLTITAECADCVSAMDESQFPRLIRLATFQTEQDAH